MAYYDFYTDPSGDNDVVLNDTGDFRFTETRAESLIQRLTIRYNTWMGEWKYNTEFGTPWIQRILKGGLTQSQLDSEMRRIALEEDDVTAVKNIESTYDNATRVYEVTNISVYCDDDTWDIPLANAATRTNSYPTPMSYDDFVACELESEEIATINELHEFLNVDMDVEGDSAWWRDWVTSDSDKEIVDAAINTNLE